MDHKMSKELPVCFEEQLRRDCPALFTETPLVRTGGRGIRGFQPHDPSAGVPSEPGDEMGDNFMNHRPQAPAQRPLPQAPPGQAPVGRQKLAPLAQKREEQQAAEQMRQQLVRDMQGLSFDAMNQIAKHVRYLKMSQNKQGMAQQQRSPAMGGPAPQPGWMGG